MGGHNPLPQGQQLMAILGYVLSSVLVRGQVGSMQAHWVAGAQCGETQSGSCLYS